MNDDPQAMIQKLKQMSTSDQAAIVARRESTIEDLAHLPQQAHKNDFFHLLRISNPLYFLLLFFENRV